MTPDHLRAESKAVQQEAGGELTTRAALLWGAAEEIERLTRYVWFSVAVIGCQAMLIGCLVALLVAS